MSTAPVCWAGWHRDPGGSWRKLVEGTDWGGCWSILLDRIAGLGGGESIVLPRGKHPGDTSAVNAERRARRS